MQKNHGSIVAENGEEELLMLAGRVNALEAYLNCSEHVDGKVVGAMLGLSIKPKDEMVADDLEKRGLLKITDIKSE